MHTHTKVAFSCRKRRRRSQEVGRRIRKEREREGRGEERGKREDRRADKEEEGIERKRLRGTSKNNETRQGREVR